MPSEGRNGRGGGATWRVRAGRRAGWPGASEGRLMTQPVSCSQAQGGRGRPAKGHATPSTAPSQRPPRVAGALPRQDELPGIERDLGAGYDRDASCAGLQATPMDRREGCADTRSAASQVSVGRSPRRRNGIGRLAVPGLTETAGRTVLSGARGSHWRPRRAVTCAVATGSAAEKPTALNGASAAGSLYYCPMPNISFS